MRRILVATLLLAQACLGWAQGYPNKPTRIDAAGIVPGYLDPAAFVEFMRADLAKGVSLLKAANFQPE